MDAREQLRRYLEQRREMGESELVLDSMSVDEALRLVAGGGGAGSGKRDAGSGEARPVAAEPRVASEPRVRSEPVVGGDADWRQALMATGSGPGGSKPVAPTPAAATPAAEKPLEELSLPKANIAAPVAAGGPIEVVPLPASRFALPGLASLDAIAQQVAGCQLCPLYATATNPVPGEGNPNADLMCVGEAPGATEDETGRPFIGAAGQLLTKILAAIDLTREQVYICNVLKHRPPGNRNPKPEEVTACSPYLIRQIELIQPKVIIALGTFAAQTLLDTKLTIGKLRGQVHKYYGVPLIVTYHPAALLRNPAWKRPTWEDVQLARRILDSSSPGA